MKEFIDIVFDGPPGPVSGRFVEVEDETGKSVRIGLWLQTEDTYWRLRIIPEMLTKNWQKFLAEFVKMGNDPNEFTLDQLKQRYDESPYCKVQGASMTSKKILELHKELQVLEEKKHIIKKLIKDFEQECLLDRQVEVECPVCREVTTPIFACNVCKGLKTIKAYKVLE